MLYWQKENKTKNQKQKTETYPQSNHEITSVKIEEHYRQYMTSVLQKWQGHERWGKTELLQIGGKPRRHDS